MDIKNQAPGTLFRVKTKIHIHRHSFPHSKNNVQSIVVFTSSYTFSIWLSLESSWLAFETLASLFGCAYTAFLSCNGRLLASSFSNFESSLSTFAWFEWYRGLSGNCSAKTKFSFLQVEYPQSSFTWNEWYKGLSGSRCIPRSTFSGRLIPLVALL